MATYEEELERVVSAITEQMPVTPQEVTKEAFLVADLGADSLDIVQILTTLEEQTELDLLDSNFAEIQRMSTLGDQTQSTNDITVDALVRFLLNKEAAGAKR